MALGETKATRRVGELDAPARVAGSKTTEPEVVDKLVADRKLLLTDRPWAKSAKRFSSPN